MSKTTPIAFHNGYNYDYHFITRELAEQFKNQFTCLRENYEKYINFTAPVEKGITSIDNNGKEVIKNRYYM